MAAVISLLAVLVVSLVAVRVGTVALTLTGLSRELARFQARSAFTGSGFTTKESEHVVNHPVRRRIIMLLMLLGNAGIVTAVASMMLSFVGTDPTKGWMSSLWLRVLVLLTGLALLWVVGHSRWVDQRMSHIVGWALNRWTNLQLRDYASLLQLTGQYIIVELQVEPGDWLADRSLDYLRLADEGALVLGIKKPDGTYLGAPRGKTVVTVGDTLVLYSTQPVLEELDQRCVGVEGDRAHDQAIQRQKRAEANETE